MKTTQNLEMKIPEGADPIDIADITGNFEKLDTEIAKKASSSGGDISSMTVKTLDTIATEFPVPSAGESSKTFMGKVRKFIQDFNDFKTGILTLGRLVNNGQTTEPGFALDARYGKTLYDLYAQVNSNFPYKAKIEAFYLTNFAEYGGLYYHDFTISNNDKIPILLASVSGVNNFVNTSITGVTATGYRVWADSKITDAVVNILVLIPK